MTFCRILLLTSFTLSCCNAPEAFAACKEQSLGGMAAWKRVDKLFENWLRDGAHSDMKDWQWKRYVDLDDGKNTSVLYGVTHMGNGTIQLKNVMLRTYRAHQGEGFIYRPYALRVQLRPGPSGCRLFVSGNIELLDEGDDKVIGHERAGLTYDYDSPSGKFHIVPGHQGAFDKIDLSDHQK